MRGSNRALAARSCRIAVFATSVVWLSFAAFGAAEGSSQSCIAAKSLDTMQACDANLLAMAVRKDEVFLLMGEGGVPEKLVAVRVGKPLAMAAILIPARPGRVLASVHAAKDAVYVFAREGKKTNLLRIPVRMSGVAEVGFSDKYAFHCRNCRSFPELRTNRVMEIPFPSGGDVFDVRANPATRGITFALDRFEGGRTDLHFDPSAYRLAPARS